MRYYSESYLITYCPFIPRPSPFPLLSIPFLLSLPPSIAGLPSQLAHLSPSTDGRIVLIDGPEVIEYLEDLRTIWEVKNNPTPLSDLTEMEGDEGGWGDESGGGCEVEDF